MVLVYLRSFRDLPFALCSSVPPSPRAPTRQLEVEWSYSADDNMGPPGDSRRRFTLPMDLTFDKVCDLLHKLSGRAQLLPPTKNTPPSAASSSGKTAPPPGKSLTRDLLQESLSRHKRLAFRMVLSCLTPILMGGAGLPAMTEENVVAAEKRRRLEEGGADMLERAPRPFERPCCRIICDTRRSMSIR